MEKGEGREGGGRGEGTVLSLPTAYFRLGLKVQRTAVPALNSHKRWCKGE